MTNPPNIVRTELRFKPLSLSFPVFLPRASAGPQAKPALPTVTRCIAPRIIMMKHKLNVLACSLALVFGVAQPATAQAADAPAVVSAEDQTLTPETLYLLLLAEIAGARGQVDVAVEAYLRASQLTRDGRVARRATEVALYARDPGAAAEAARIWTESDPDSDEAKRILSSILASGGQQLNSVQFELARILANHPEQLEENLLTLNRALSRLPDKRTVRNIVFRLTEPYLDQPAAHFARSQAALGSGEEGDALESIEHALTLRPNWSPAILLKTQMLLQHGAADTALDFLRGHMAADPDNPDLRLTYARALASTERYDEALREFETLLAQEPSNADLMFAVALVAQETGDLDKARQRFEEALLAGHGEVNGIRLSLGNIAEQQGQADAALQWFSEIPPGQHYLEARSRAAMLLAKQGKVDEARSLVQASARVHEGDDKRLLMVESMILRDARLYADALNLLDEALRETPDDPELLYESAMLAERLNLLERMETRLRRLIEVQPEYAHAYNALGYSLADRGLRLQEAESLIVQALELSPEDPFILDSMGWVRFRQQDLDGALDYLQRAYAQRQDAEIAAHLGEVLWQLQRQADARKIWLEALQRHPQNDLLIETMQRLDPR